MESMDSGKSDIAEKQENSLESEQAAIHNADRLDWRWSFGLFFIQKRWRWDTDSMGNVLASTPDLFAWHACGTAAGMFACILYTLVHTFNSILIQRASLYSCVVML